MQIDEIEKYEKYEQDENRGEEAWAVKKRMFALLCSVLIVLATWSGVLRFGVRASAETIDAAEMAEEVAVLLNTFRQENGLDALKTAPVLSELSGIRAKELVDCYGHTRPDGTDWFTVVEESALDSNCYAAENIAAGYDSPEAVITAWENSPNHRAAMLGENYQYVGIGLHYVEEDPNYYFTYWEMLLISSETPMEGEYFPDEKTDGGTNRATMTDVSAEGKNETYQTGDMDLDGEVSLADAVLLQKLLLKQTDATETQRKNGDCYADGILDSRDAVSLMRFLVGLTDTLPE